ncbi:hypothetical protein J6590_032999 [Homalodisca vitripennis]|nr:hypothetical protein J6590_032999 [Homalodisca vitripennis]
MKKALTWHTDGSNTLEDTEAGSGATWVQGYLPSRQLVESTVTVRSLTFGLLV